MGGGAAKSDRPAPEDVNGHKFLGQVVEGFDPKGLRAAVDDMKKRLGSGIGALVAVNDGRASVAVGVTDDLAGQVSAVDLVKAAVATLGGQGGGGRARHGAGRRPRRLQGQGSARSGQGRAGEGRGLIDTESSEPVTLNGACHCGAVKFTVTLTEGFASARRCTCSICRMRGAVAVTSTPDAFRITQGEDKLATYRFNTKTAEHHFCTVCGIYTHHKRRSNPDQLGVNVACLEGVSPFDFREVDRVRRKPAPGRQCRAQDLRRRRAPVRAGFRRLSISAAAARRAAALPRARLRP